MKKTVLSLAALALASQVSAAPLALGTQEIRFDGMIDFDSVAGTDISINVGYGYFIMDYLEVGGIGGITDNDIVTTFSVGGFAEYNIDTATELIPFLGSQLRLVYADIDVGATSESQTALALGLYAGAKFFLTEGLAISGRFMIEVASDDIFPEEKKVNDVNFGIDFGLRYFF
ncbi:MAG TPA: outer membrane beta-barrel protein [Kiritimatiellia bacterium]|nr:outer membrane beta-barrel protein [Kiritimatiellia bacterium]